jgi:hypothetical protein
MFIFGIKRDIFKITPGNPEIFCGIIFYPEYVQTLAGTKTYTGI